MCHGASMHSKPHTGERPRPQRPCSSSIVACPAAHAVSRMSSPLPPRWASLPFSCLHVHVHVHVVCGACRTRDASPTLEVSLIKGGREAPESAAERHINITTLLDGTGILTGTGAEHARYRWAVAPWRPAGTYGLALCSTRPRDAALGEFDDNSTCSLLPDGSVIVRDEAGMPGRAPGSVVRFVRGQGRALPNTTSAGAGVVAIPFTLSPANVRESDTRDAYVHGVSVALQLDEDYLTNLTVRVGVLAQAVASQSSFLPPVPPSMPHPPPSPAGVSGRLLQSGTGGAAASPPSCEGGAVEVVGGSQHASSASGGRATTPGGKRAWSPAASILPTSRRRASRSSSSCATGTACQLSTRTLGGSSVSRTSRRAWSAPPTLLPSSRRRCPSNLWATSCVAPMGGGRRSWAMLGRAAPSTAGWRCRWSSRCVVATTSSSLASRTQGRRDPASPRSRGWSPSMASVRCPRTSTTQTTPSASVTRATRGLRIRTRRASSAWRACSKTPLATGHATAACTATSCSARH